MNKLVMEMQDILGVNKAEIELNKIMLSAGLMQAANQP